MGGWVSGKESLSISRLLHEVRQGGRGGEGGGGEGRGGEGRGGEGRGGEGREGGWVDGWKGKEDPSISKLYPPAGYLDGVLLQQHWVPWVHH